MLLCAALVICEPSTASKSGATTITDVPNLPTVNGGTKAKRSLNHGGWGQSLGYSDYGSNSGSGWGSGAQGWSSGNQGWNTGAQSWSTVGQGSGWNNGYAPEHHQYLGQNTHTHTHSVQTVTKQVAVPQPYPVTVTQKVRFIILSSILIMRLMITI